MYKVPSWYLGWRPFYTVCDGRVSTLNKSNLLVSLSGIVQDKDFYMDSPHECASWKEDISTLLL